MLVHTFHKVPLQFPRPAQQDWHRIACAWLSWLAPPALPVGICLLRGSYITPRKWLIWPLYGIHGKKHCYWASNVTSLYDWIHLSTVGKFTCSHDILVGRAWQWADSDCCFAHPRSAKYWLCWQIWQRWWKITMFFPRIRDSALLSSCATILPLIMTSQEIRVKQVNYFFFLESGQQPAAAAAAAAFWKVSIGNTCSDWNDGDNYVCPAAPRAAVRPVWNNMQSAGTR